MSMLEETNVLNIGLIINPWAGIGGQVALKGSDGVLDKALALGATSRVHERVSEFLLELNDIKPQIHFVSFPESMGGAVLKEQNYSFQLIEPSNYSSWQVGHLQAEQTYINSSPQAHTTSALDTQEAASKMAALGLDLIVFAGGDGTARDIAKGLVKYPNQVCLGIPAGVKIQSGVYGRTPRNSAQLVLELVSGTGLSIQSAEVRDIDESALRQGVVKSSRYADLMVPSFPAEGLSLQGSKLSTLQTVFAASQKSSSQPMNAMAKQGQESASQGYQVEDQQEDQEEIGANKQYIIAEELAAEEIAACLIERSEDMPNQLLMVGPGKTTMAFKQRINSSKCSLLGVDVYFNGECLLSDATEQQLLKIVDNPALEIESLGIIVSLIGGQGCVFGRGNQQMSHKLIGKVLEKSGKGAITVLATSAKLEALKGKSLFVDTGNLQLDLALQGLCKVLVDYNYEMLCHIKN